MAGELAAECQDSGSLSALLTNVVAADPDTVLGVPLGAQCISFMRELGNQKAASGDAFDPLVYLTATCVTPAFFGPPGPAADGIYTSSNLIDPNDSANADVPEVEQYLEAFRGESPDGEPGGMAVAGWLAAELTVEALRQAPNTEGGLTRANIVNAARNIDYKPTMFRGDLRAVMNAEDGYIAEGTQIIRWSAEEHLFEDVGDIGDLEGTTGIYTP